MYHLVAAAASALALAQPIPLHKLRPLMLGEKAGPAPALFQESRWGIDQNACDAPTDFAPGLVVWFEDRVIAEGRQMTITKVLASGKNFLSARMSSGPATPGGAHSFRVMGQKKMQWDDRSTRPATSRGPYLRCGLAEGEETPTPPPLFQADRWGTNEDACRGETVDGAGLVEFTPTGMRLEGSEASIGRIIAAGSNFMRAPFHFRDVSGTVTTRDLGFSIIDGRKLTMREYHRNTPTELGSYYKCP